MTNIGLTQDVSRKVADKLEQMLANEYVLSVKLKNYHWNVKGMNFTEHHEYFEELYDEASDNTDEIAERVRMLGFNVIGSMAEFTKISKISEEKPGSFPKVEVMFENLLNDIEMMIRLERGYVQEVGELGDTGNEDFINAVMQKHEKIAWFLRSHLSK